MKTNAELEQIVDTIRTGYQLRSETIAGHANLLRSIQIDALREAREIINTGYDDGIVSRDYHLQRIDKLIRELELK